MNSRCALRANFALVLKHWRLQHHIPRKQMAAEVGVRPLHGERLGKGERFPDGFALENIVIYTHFSPCRLFCDRAERCAPGQCRFLAGRA